MTDPSKSQPSPAPPAGGFGAHDARASQPPIQFPPPPVVARPKGMPGWAIALLATAAVGILLVGVLAALAISGTRKYIAQSKMAEARNSVGMMAKDAVAHYEEENDTKQPTTNGASTPKQLCASATSPVPAAIGMVAGKKYASSPSDWEQDKDARAGFSCLGFRMDYPQYYQYDYKSGPTTISAIARGDIDGNGALSEFRLGGTVEGGTLLIDRTIQESNPEE